MSELIKCFEKRRETKATDWREDAYDQMRVISFVDKRSRRRNHCPS